MVEGEKNDLRAVCELRLIDFSAEDDCLIDASPGGLSQHLISPENQKEHKSFEILESVNAKDVTDIFGQKEQSPQSSKSLKLERERKIGKCNLRKSLAWDNAFFTSAGVLDPEEFSSMIEGVKSSEKHPLPGIPEDACKSTDSISTLESDGSMLESIEADLFEDIRASIQKSSKTSYLSNSSDTPRSGRTETQPTCSSKKVDLASQNRKSSGGIPGSEKTVKQASVCRQITQPVAKSRESTSSLPKLPKLSGRVNHISEAQTKRASLGVGRTKVEIDSAKGVTAAGRGAPVTKNPGVTDSRSIAPRVKPPSTRSSSLVSSTTRQPTSSRSSIDSSSSSSSDNISKSPLNSQRKKIDFKFVTMLPSGSMSKTPSRIAARHKTQPGSSNLSAFLKSTSKHSSSISPTSSISELSVESSSSTSTVNQRSNNSNASLENDSPCRANSVDSDASHVSDQKTSDNQILDGLQNRVNGLSSQTVKRASAGRGLPACPTSIKPSGLRMPSPKIGFFDGVKPAMRATKEDLQSRSGLPAGLPKITASICSTSGVSNKAKLGKLQAARTVMATGKIKHDTQKTTLKVKSTSPAPVQASSTSSTKFSGALKNVKTYPGISSKAQNDLPPKTRGESYLKDEMNSSHGPCTGKHVLDSDLNADEKVCEGVLTNKMRTINGGCARIEDIKTTSIKADDTACEPGSVWYIENIDASLKVDDGAIYGQDQLENNLHSLCKTNKKGKDHLDNHIEGLSELVKAVDRQMETKKEIISSSFSGSDVDCPDNVSALKLSCSRELLAYGKREESLVIVQGSNILSKPDASILETASATRIPFAVKNTSCDIDDLLDLPKGSKLEVENPATLPSTQSAQKENS
ncbi:uncharacterized protein LOC131143471 isoform X2 [Malania oleifera]|uniref:uncharacterized protein LOC131143471 isoform X2 n=1 Tax=Malania oleifera TaxID=397392 RepID=UPI0025ADE85C|nr:uncharacterized protein LOC131143471 isoform X2 [Malania oleifera]